MAGLTVLYVCPLRAATVVAPPSPPPAAVDVTLDYVGSLNNAATRIAAVHSGEKRLVFCDSRRQVEELGAALRDRGIETHLSHSSLSSEERRRAEQAFADSRDCVIVATSTLELGVDLGDLDRVIQIDAPPTVAGFLQRLGRTGRRPGDYPQLPLPCHQAGDAAPWGRVATALGQRCWWNHKGWSYRTAQRRRGADTLT
jgi:ATP-dependent helicase YprA (DUF1998 family)